MLSVGFKTDRGLCRSINEDALFVVPQQQLYIVADGVGGHNAGDRASKIAVEQIAAYVSSNPPAEDADIEQLRIYFMDCFSIANEIIYKQAMMPNESFGMASTCVACCIKDDNAFIVNVGDSRCYLVRDEVLTQITEDHSCVQEMVRSGLITPEEAMLRPDRNMITRALGGEPTVQPDFFSVSLCPGDTIILCSDGLYGELSHDRMVTLCGKYKTMHRLAKQMVDEANKHGGKDNISVICIRVQ